MWYPCNAQTTNGVVDGKREVDDGSATHRRVFFRNQDRRQTRQFADLPVIDDRALIVEDERAGETVGVSQRTNDDDERGPPP